MKARTRAEALRSGWVRSQRLAPISVTGSDRRGERRQLVADEAGQDADADAGLDRLGEAQNGVDPHDDAARRHLVRPSSAPAGYGRGCRRGRPSARTGCRRSRARQALGRRRRPRRGRRRAGRPASPAASAWRARRCRHRASTGSARRWRRRCRGGCPGRPARKLAKTGIIRCAIMVSLVVTRSSPDGLTSRPAMRRSKRGDLLAHPAGQRHHLLAGRGQGVAGPAALEQAGAEHLLDRVDAAEDGGMVDAESFGRAGERARLGDGAHVAVIVPIGGDRGGGGVSTTVIVGGCRAARGLARGGAPSPATEAWKLATPPGASTPSSPSSGEGGRVRDRRKIRSLLVFGRGSAPSEAEGRVGLAPSPSWKSRPRCASPRASPRAASGG